jgi:hypothetical protein
MQFDVARIAKRYYSVKILEGEWDFEIDNEAVFPVNHRKRDSAKR